MNNCTNCANAIFDEVWGEYKCAISQHRIYDVDAHANCENHEPKKEAAKNEQKS